MKTESPTRPEIPAELVATMKQRSRRQTRRIWITAVGCAVAVHVAAFFLFRVPRPTIKPVPGQKTEVRLGSKELVREKILLFDTTPLFFPTKWNYANADALTIKPKPPSEIFNSFPPQYSFGTQDSGFLLEQDEPAVGSAIEALNRWPPSYLDAFGQRDRTMPLLPKRAGYVEVFNVKSGKRVLSTSIPASIAGKLDWSGGQPAEFLFLNERTGPIGLPLLSSSSGSDATDTFLRGYLTSGLHLDKRLPAGYYRITVGP